MSHYQPILDQICVDIQPHLTAGKVADYIPELAAVPAAQFGMALVDIEGNVFHCGAAEQPFSMQSISKVFTLTLALKGLGRRLWERVGREPSGSAFNSLVHLEYENGKPRNPFINAGALVAQVKVASVTLAEILTALTGDLNHDGVVDDADIAFANSYLDGSVDSGDTAAERQDYLINRGTNSVDALDQLNLTEFDVDGSR